ncbi:MAG: hypothetical protein ACO1TE_17015 [Prosthecobacter sp.]
MDFQPFDPDGRVEITRKLLPHWHQERRTYFITWRTADSFPASLLRQRQAERNAWLHAHQTSLEALEHLPAEKRCEYHERFSRRWQDHLDEGHGECLLRRADVRGIVEAALRHFDGTRYMLGEFVLMPNHVHLLVSPSEGEDILDHIVRYLTSLRKIQRYIADNPLKAGLHEGSYTLYQPPDWQAEG